MLTGKKIGSLVFVILLGVLALSLVPNIGLAFSSSDYTKINTTESDPDSPNYGNGRGLFNSLKVGTHNGNTSDEYYVNDGAVAAFYSRNGNRNANSVEGHTLTSVITKDNNNYFLKTPIPKTDEASVREAINTIATTAVGEYPAGTSAYDSLQASESSNSAAQIQTQQARDAQRKLQELIAANAPAEEIAKAQAEFDTLKGPALQVATQAANQNQAMPADKIYCLQWDSPMLNLPGCAAIVSNWTMKVAAFFLWTAALLFDFTLGVTLNIRPLVEKLAIVNIGWGIFRDISNLFFIFLLLFAAIGTIVNSGKFNAKAMVPSILVAALLINFSLFFTKVIIDTSNIMALQFYANMGGGQLSVGENPLSTKVSTGGSKATGIAAIFLDSMNINNLYTISITDIKSEQTGAITAATAGSQGAGLSAYNIALVGIGGTILFLVTAFVLFAATALFITRTIILVALMTTSPIAFLAKAIPGGKLKALGDKWWDNLWKQVFFAPIYMAMMYIAVVAVRSLASAGVGVNGSWASMFNGDSSSINIIFTFVMIIGFMVFALVSAQSMGAVGASTAIGMGKKIQGWGLGALKASTIGVAGAAGGFAAKSLVGSSAYAFANSNLMRGIVSRIPGGGLIKSGVDGIAGAKFGTSKGYTQNVADRQKRREEMADFAGGSTEFRSRRSFESVDKYMAKREEYLEDEKKASAARKNRTLGLEAQKDGTITAISTAPSFTTSADIRGRRQAQQKHLSDLKKKGKAAVDKVTRKKGYLESVEEIVGKPAMEAHFGPGYKEKSVDAKDIVTFKQKLSAGTIDHKKEGKLHDLQELIKTDEGLLDTASAPGEITKLSTKLNNYYKKRDALEEKISTHLDAVDKLQQEPTT